MNISIRLKQARENKELSLSELSTLTGIAKSTLQRYETGSTRKIPMEAISTIEKVLNLPTGYLMGWENKSNEIKHSPASENITPDGQQLLIKYNKLNDLGKEKTNEYVDDLIANERYTTPTTVSKPKEVRYVGKKDGTVKIAAYGGGVKTNKKKIKHT